MNAGVVTAYGAAKAGGYTGTYEQFCALMASIGKLRHIWTGVCDTAKSTAAKVVTLDDSDGFSLSVGNCILVYFKSPNGAQNPTLNVNGTGAKSVYYSKTTSLKTKMGTDAPYYEWGVGLKLLVYEEITSAGSTQGHWVMSAPDYTHITYLLANKADSASPALTGTPTAPTAASGTDTTQIATTAFVQNEVGNLETSINTALENLRTRIEGSVLVIGSTEGE